MFDATKVSNRFEIQVIETPSMVLVGDLQNIQPSYRLNEKNYLKWSQFVPNLSKREGQIESSPWQGFET